jgi:hypothetical protein
MRTSTEQWLVGFVLTLVVAGLLWFAWSRQRTPELPQAEPAASLAQEIEAPASPRFPVRAPLEPPAEPGSALIPLPPLADSDQYFGLALTDVFGTPLEGLLVNEALIEKFVATVDNLPRSRYAERLRPTKAAPGQFAVNATGDEDIFTLSSDNFARYTTPVEMLANADTAELVATYRRFYPLLQQAYVELGYPDGYFNDRLIEVIDHLLEQPIVPGELKLARPHVLYEYADAGVEDLSSGQKLMLRIGADNAAKVRSALSRFRDTLLAEERTNTEAQ